MNNTLHFYKYQGTGNDFIMVDNRSDFFEKNNTKLVQFLCDRKFGIGADGLILIEKHPTCDFKMVYYNSDGNESSMCGNGGRCSVAFAKELGIIDNECTFIATDGLHYAKINDQEVSLQMIDVEHISINENNTFLNTGSPHHVEIVDNVNDIDVFETGKKIRNSKTYAPGGTNVNFVEIISDASYKIRTYERGVEDETLSCGTGATAVALSMYALNKTDKNSVTISVLGGNLKVSFEKHNNIFKNIFLTGPATKVFEGNINCLL